MNTKQKVLTGIALLAFIISSANAPWEVIQYEYGSAIPVSRRVENYPVWGPSFHSLNDVYQLQWLPLAGMWLVIGVIYAGLFFMMKTGPKKS